MTILLREALPRLYKDIVSYFEKNESIYIEQIKNLKIYDWCDCGSEHCFSLYFEGKTGLRPLYYDMNDFPISISYGLSGEILTGFEILSDYPDGYIRAFLTNILDKECETVI